MSEPSRPHAPLRRCARARQRDSDCVQFRAAWKAGHAPKIEDYLDRYDKAEKPAFLWEILKEEKDLFDKRGESVDLEDLVRRFPAYESIVVEAIRGSEAKANIIDRMLESEVYDDRDRFRNFVRQDRENRERRGEQPEKDDYWISVLLPDSFRKDLDDVFNETLPHRSKQGNEVSASIPKRIGKYEIVCFLGEGRQGKVYKAKDPKLNRYVAIKVVCREYTEESRAALHEEARKLATLKDERIVSVYEVSEDSIEGPFIVLQFVDGTRLDKWIEEARREREPDQGWRYHKRVARLLAKVAEAVHLAHEKGIIHYDLKPANILVVNDSRKGDEPRVTDFGLSIHEGEPQEAEAEKGTPLFMAPEQVLLWPGRHHREGLDRRVDVWALGVILYEALCGRYPFSGPSSSRDDVYLSIATKAPERPGLVARSIIPRELERICLKCLTKETDQRYKSAAELATELNAWAIRPDPKVDVNLEHCSPWQQAQQANLPVIGRSNELKTLDECWDNDKIHVVTIHGQSGVGKSALVGYWLKLMEMDQWRKAEWVFGWSFSDQDRGAWVTSVSRFFSSAMDSLHARDKLSESLWRRGVTLAELIQKRRSLLILDGLDEPLLDRVWTWSTTGQTGMDQGAAQEAWVNDQSLLALLLKLTDPDRKNDKNGLCILTSRLRIRELRVSSETSGQGADAPRSPRNHLPEQNPSGYESSTVALICLGPLDREERAKVLLQRLPGLTEGNENLGRDVERLVNNVAGRLGGHPLSLDLLGTYLNRQPDDAKRKLLNQLRNEGGDGDKGPGGFLRIFERWLEELPECLQALRLLALFERPARASLLDNLRKINIAGITDRLVELSDDEWQKTLDRLRDLNLLIQVSTPEREWDIPHLVSRVFGRETPGGFRRLLA